MKKDERGSYGYCYDESNKIFALIRNDNNGFKVLSNYLELQPLDKVKRYSKKEKIECPVHRPNIVGHMGGVDKLDW